MTQERASLDVDVVEKMKQAVKEVLDERDGLDRETHHAHHLYVSELLERRQKREALYEKAKSTAVGALVVATIAMIGKFLTWVAAFVHVGIGKQ